MDITDEDYDPDYDWDDEPYREPDPDYEQAEAYEQYREHCDQVHGGRECDCRPSVLVLLCRRATRNAANAWYSARAFARQMHTIRIGPLELTARYRPPPCCGACGGRGWSYTKGTTNPQPMPEGYDGTALCGCGSAITRLAESRRYVRKAMKEPPF